MLRWTRFSCGLRQVKRSMPWSRTNFRPIDSRVESVARSVTNFPGGVGVEDLRRAAAAEFGVHMTGGRWCPPEAINDPAYAYVFQEAKHQNDCFLDLLIVFVRADTDRTGTLDRQQLSNAIKDLKGNALSRSELQEMFYTLDRNGDGTIDYLEFAQVVEIFNEGEFE